MHSVFSKLSTFFTPIVLHTNTQIQILVMTKNVFQSIIYIILNILGIIEYTLTIDLSCLIEANIQ